MQQMFTLKTPQLVQTVSVFSIILVSLLVCMNVVVGFVFGYACMIINLEMVPIQMNAVSVRKKRFNLFICLYI
jgi:hypothetical protein